MKLIGTLNSVSMYNKVSSKLDGIVLGTRFSFYANNIFTDEELDILIKKAIEDNKLIFLLVNIVMHEEYVGKVNDFINKYKDENVYFIYQDLGVLNILNKLNIIHKGIYNPLTMITNYEDLLMYDSLGVDGVGLSNEIPLDDVKKCSDKSSKVFYLGFGYHPMYQTYRKLASLYKDYSGLDYSLNNLSIKELNKEFRLPMSENEFGTVVFRGGVISVLEGIEKLKDVKYLLLDGIFLTEDKQIKVIDIYSDVINNLITKEEGMKLISKLDFTYSNKFLNEDSVYNPEDF